MSEQPSLTNLEAVKPKGPRIFIGALAFVIAFGVGWWFLRDDSGPRGERDDPARILLVSEDAQLKPMLVDLGFEVEQQSLEAIQARADEEIDDAEGLGAVLHLADVLGYGYVAFERPDPAGFADLTVTAESVDLAGDEDFVVFSVGDVGYPPHVSSASHPSLYDPPRFVLLLRALFDQDRLAATLLPEQQRSMQAQPLGEKLDDAIDLLGAYGLIDNRAKGLATARHDELETAETVKPPPAILGVATERSRAFPLADGGLLLVVEAPVLLEPEREVVELTYPGQARFAYQPPGTDDVGSRVPCPSLHGGAIARDAHLLTSNGQRVLAVIEGEQIHVWRLDPEGEACTFQRLGSVPAPVAGDMGSVHDDGRLARAAARSDALVVEIWTPDSGTPQELLMPGCTRIGDPVWLDDQVLAISCRHEPQTAAELGWGASEPTVDPERPESVLDEPAPPVPDESWLYVARLTDGAIAALPAARFGEYDGVYDLEPVLGDEQTALVLAQQWGGQARLITAAMPGSALIDAALAPPDDPEQPRRPAFVPAAVTVTLGIIPPGTFAVRELDLKGGVRLRAGPDGRRLAVEVDATAFDPHARNVAVLDLDSGKLERLVNNPRVEHMDPRFTADGKHLVFTSRYVAGNETMTAARVAVLP